MMDGMLLITLLNGLSYGLLLFMLSAGLTLIMSMMGVINFAHASFYMLGAYVASTLTAHIGFWPALLLAPLCVGALGALFEVVCLRKVHAHGHVAELLVTFGLSYIVLEVVQLIWGKSSVPLPLPSVLQGALLTVDGVQFPRSRAFIMAVALCMLLLLWLVFARTRIGLIIQAALTKPDMVQALGHNVPRLFMWVFAVGTGLAALAGVVAGTTYIVEPSMAISVGSIIFVVVVVGGMGSLLGAFLTSLFIGLLQTFAVVLDYSALDLLRVWGIEAAPQAWFMPLLRLTVSQIAPIVPYLLLVLVLVLRPRGLLGKREA